jgi:hypothetical protein
MASDSRVIDALHVGSNLERLLQALGCDTRKDISAPFDSPHGFISCPMPDHPDANPSCKVNVGAGQFYCHSLCEQILPLDLVIAHGHASSRGDAAKWVEQALGIERAPLPPGGARPLVDDPSLTVDDYLTMKGLPADIATLFGLEDVRVKVFGIDDDGTNRGGKQCLFPTGFYNAVFMPTRPGRRPRVRTAAPDAPLKWATRARHLDGSIRDHSTFRSPDGPVLESPLDVIGLAQLRPADGSATGPDGPASLLLCVEGESDTHALHAMGMPFVVGVPGAKMGRRLAGELLEAALLATGGDTDLARLTVLVWQEPGAAGAAFPGSIATALTDAAMQHGLPAPRVMPLHHASVAGEPKDPASLLLDRPLETAREQVAAAIASALAPIAPESIPASIAQALEPAQVGGLATQPPATSHPDAPTAGPSPAPPAWMDTAPPRSTRSALWTAFDEIAQPPHVDLAPERVEGAANAFVRTTDGWSLEKTDKEGDTTLVPICGAFVVERVERCSGEILVRIAAPFGGAWNRLRIEMGATADAGRTCGALAKVGVSIVNRQRPAVTDLLLALVVKLEQTVGATHVPAGTGWSGMPGTGGFGGIDIEPVNDFGARMFEANARRRQTRPDTNAAARKWWNAALKLLADPIAGPTASGAAPLLALGAAAAAPLVGPLAEVGVTVAPVVWIAGLGGGGKSVTQKLAASIFAPSLPDLDGQSAFFANANISQAALSARVDSCRDLPLILDDVTQLPPLPGSTSRGDAARIEAAAALGMMVFNRKPIERATREGGIRQTRAFRSSAIFSAEVSMSSETSKAVVTAGHRRRISTIEARPMTERGLAQDYAELVNDISATVGGAPGELLIADIVELVTGRKLRALFDQVRRRIAAMPEAADVTMTQREAVAVSTLGFCRLAMTSGGWAFVQALEFACETLAPYLAAGAGEGGATRDADLSGVAAALRSVDDLRAAHPLRFERQIADDLDYQPNGVPTAGYLGKELRPLHDGTRRIAMLRPGMEMLNSRYGVTQQVIEQAISEGACQARKQIRMWDNSRVYAVVWLLPPAEHVEPEVDPTLPVHDPDPHGLLVPSGNDSTSESDSGVALIPNGTNPIRVPGAGAAPEPAASKDVAARNLERMIASDEHTKITWTEGDEIMDARFAWGAGIYLVGDGPAMRDNQSLHVTIRREAVDELAALAEQYDGTGIEVAPMPADDDPRWAKLEAIGAEAARAQWNAAHEALWRRNQVEGDARLEHDRAHVKAYRVHLMARYRRPEWFIVGTDRA